MALELVATVGGQDERRVGVDAVTLIGRDVEGPLRYDDTTISRRHASFEPAGDTVIVRDLGSANGTFVNGVRIAGEHTLRAGDVVHVGETQIHVVTTDAGTAVAVTTSDLHELRRDRLVVRFRPSTPGAAAAPAVLAAAVAARRALSIMDRDTPELALHLVDPFPDPDQPDALVTNGTVLDAGARVAWMVVTAESPPEDPHRPLALLLAATLPNAVELELVVEGYALHLAGLPDPDPQLRAVTLPSLADADGELRSAMALSYARFLLASESVDGFGKLLAAPAGRLEHTCRSVYGRTPAALEQAWRQDLAVGERRVRTGQFLKLSLRYLRPYKRRQIEIAVYMLFSLGFTAAFPFVTRALFDSAIPSGEFSEVLTLLMVLAGAFAVSLIAGLRQSYLSAWVSGAIVRDLRRAMFYRLQDVPLRWFATRQQGDVLSRLFNDVGRVEAGVSEAIATGAYQLLTLVMSAAIMMTLDWKLGLIVLAGAPLVGLVYRSMAAGARNRSVLVQEEQSGLVSVAAENFVAQPVVKVFGLAGRERERFDLASERLFGAQRGMAMFSGLFGLSVNGIVTLLRLVVLGLGAWLILEGQFTIGGLVGFLGVMGDVIAPVTGLTGVGQQIQTASGALERVNEVLQAPQHVADDVTKAPLAPLAHEICLTNVSFSYNPGSPVLQGIDVTVAAGSRVAFVGTSGSGKSTIMRLLMRIDDPDDGCVSVDGVDVRDRSLSSWRDQLGVVQQEPILFDTTIRENIELGCLGATLDEIVAAADAAEVGESIEAMPRGYETIVGERGGNLSGGQRQRVSIARALVRHPRVLLLDEATSALDPRTERQIVETLRRASGDRTVIAVTHRLASVVDYDCIFVVEQGRIVERGTHEELLGAGGAYAALWAEQTPPGEPIVELDVAAALERIVLFRSLGGDELAAVASRLDRVALERGATFPEDGRLALVAQGVAEITTTAFDGRRLVAAELRVGEAFGVAGALGAPAGAELHAATDVTLLVLDADDLSMLATTFPSVAQALGQGEPTERVRGRKLTTATGVYASAALVPTE